MIQLSNLPMGPWAVDIYDEHEFYTSLTCLITANPQIHTWLFKLDDERESRGHVYLDIEQIKGLVGMLDALGAAACGAAENAGVNDAEEEPCVAIVPLVPRADDGIKQLL